MKLIVGLGNPGKEYESTRHNAGAWFVRALAFYFGVNFSWEPKFQGEMARVQKDGRDFRLLIPSTFMNLSGQSIQAVATFYKIFPNEILVIHDEIDLPVGQVKLKFAGGDGGQRGVRSTISHIGLEFWRLRIGVGHPGHKDQVSDYVLHAPSKAEQVLIEQSLEKALENINLILDQKTDQFMNHINRQD